MYYYGPPMILEQSVTLLAFCCLIAVCSAIHDPLPYTNPVKLNPAEFQKNIQQELCIRKAQLYRECSFTKESIVREIKKETGNNLALTRGAQAISVPIGCKATLYNEQRHFAIHIRGPKNYCSEINTLGSIDMVRLEDSAGIASLESELVKTEKTLEGYKRDMDYFEKKVTSTAIELRNIPGPKGPTGTQGLTVRGELGERGAKGPAGLKGPKGHIGAHGNQGSSGLRGIQGLKGAKGERGIEGIDGDPFQGPRGPRGDPGVSLTYQTFEFDKDFRNGEYVFSKANGNSRHDSLFIAKKSFNSGKKYPYQDVDHVNWIKFVGLHGVDGTDGINVVGEKGEKGEKGDQAEPGEDGKMKKKMVN